MAHQAVEVDRAGQADVAGVVGDLGHLRQLGLEVAHGGVGALQGRALVEVEHQQQLVLVVERQHLQRHDPQSPPAPSRRPSSRAITSRNDTAASRELSSGAISGRKSR